MKKEFSKLSVVMPVYNEISNLPLILDRLEKLSLQVEVEVIIVDDGSTDGSRRYIESLPDDRYKKIFKENGGKGSALRMGFKEVTGDMVIVQDADLEYDLNDYDSLLKPIIDGKADVVYGSRFLDLNKFSSPYRMHVINNKAITFVSNIFTGLSITDMETCYKVFRRDVLDSFKDRLTSNKFEIEPELTQYVARGGFRLIEVPISYRARTFAEGKKITIIDGFAGIFHIIRLFLRY